MATEQEEITARIGLNFTAMETATKVMLAQQEKAAASFTAFWNKAVDEVQAKEIRANEASLARLKAFQAAKLNMQREFFAEQAAQAEIAGGSVPESMAAGAVGARLAGGAARSAEHAGGSTIVRETAVLFREGLRGNFTRMIGSLTILVGAIGVAAAAVVAGLAAIAGFPAYRTFQAMKGEKQGAADLKDKVGLEAEELKRRIDLMKSGGLIDAKTAEDWANQLHDPSFDSVNRVLGFVNSKMPKGGLDALAGLSKDNEQRKQNLKEEAESQERLAHRIKELDRESMTNQEKVNDDKKTLLELNKQIILGHLHDKDIGDQLLEQEEATIQLKIDQQKLDKEKSEELKKQEEVQKRIADLEREKQMVQLSGDADFQKQFGEFPTIEELARQTFRDRWSGRRRYSSTALEAQRYLWDAYYQKRARAFGDSDAGDFYQNDMASISADFQDRGMIKKDESLIRMEAHLANLNQQIADVKNGKTLQVDITAVTDSQ